MKTYNYPYLALGLGLLLLVIIMKGSETDAEGMTLLPLLTLLIINECAFILTAAAVYIGAQLSELSYKNAKQTWLMVAGIIAMIVVVIIIGVIANHALARVTASEKSKES